MWHGGVQAVADKPGSKVDANDTSLLDKGSCAGVSRLGGDGDSYATVIAWINNIQTKCEARPHGIPYICSVDPYATLGIPSTVGLAPAMDKDLWRKAGMWIGRAWSSIGVRCELGPQIDLYTDPTVARLNGAETEDPALARDFTQPSAGMQSTWGDDGHRRPGLGQTCRCHAQAPRGRRCHEAAATTTAIGAHVFPGD